MDKIAQHWHVAGLGAIGSLCTHTGQQSGLNITSLVRLDSQSYCQTFIDLSSQEHLLPAPKSINHIESISNLVVPLKSYDVVPFLLNVVERLDDNAQVILCHNGMGTIEQALDILPNTVNLYFCTSSHGVFKDQRKACYAGEGESSWKLIRKGNHAILSNEQVNAILPNAKLVDDLSVLLWQKLIINCAINPLTAVHRVKNGELAAPQYQPQVTAIVQEAVTVANACGIDINYPTMFDKVVQVIEQTGANTSSMLQDVLNNKPTEIEFITGYLLQQAKQHGIKAPTNEMLYHKVRELV